MVVLSLLASAFCAGKHPDTPFPNRIIFSETPETGLPWHGGIRMKDLLCWDVYWNAGGWLTLDLLYAGINDSRMKDEENGGTVSWTDRLALFSIKSRPLSFSLSGHPYKVGAGLTVYSSAFEFWNTDLEGGYPATSSKQTGLFLAQSLFLGGRHYCNLDISFTTYKVKAEDAENAITTFYFIPGYRFLFGPKLRWSFDLEYYLMNPIELPFKTLQIAANPATMDFYNPNQRYVSFMFWGVSYSWQHLTIGAHLGNHISFSGVIIPLLGVGWDF